MNARHTVLGAAFAAALSPLSPLLAVDPVIAPDDGTGSIAFPVLNTPLTNGTRVRKGMQELKGASQEVQIELVSLDLTSCDPPVVGGTLGGQRTVCNGSATVAVEQGHSRLRLAEIPIVLTLDTGPRTPGDAVQDFDTDMFRLEGELFGDPDFDLLRITGGTDLGLPSPGHTTLTRLGPPGSDFAVDSFFDIEYRIEFTSTPTGSLPPATGDVTESARCEQPLRLANGVPFDPLAGSSVVRTPDGLVCRGGGGGGGVIRLASETLSLNYEEIRWSYLTSPTGNGLELPNDGDSLALDMYTLEYEKATPRLCRSVCTTSGGNVQITPDFSPLGATGTLVEVWHLGQLVGSAIAPNGTVACSVAAGDFQLHAVDIHGGRSTGVRRHRGDTTLGDVVVVKEMDASTPRLCNTPGGSFLGSELRFSPVGATARVGTIGHVDHLCSRIVVIDDDSVRIYDRKGGSPRLRAVGDAGLSKPDAKRALEGFVVSNLGSSGQDGVSVDLGDDGEPPVVFRFDSFRCGEPDGIGPAATGGLWLEASSLSGGTLGSLSCTSAPGGAGGGGRVVVRSDLSPTGTPTALVRVLDEGAVVGELQVPVSGDTEVCAIEDGPDGAPYLRLCGKNEASPPFDLPCFFMEFDRPVSVTPTGAGTPLQGTRVEVLADGATVPPEPIRLVSLRCDSPVPLKIREVYHGPDRFPGFIWSEGTPVFPPSVALVCREPAVFDTTPGGAPAEGLEFRVRLLDLVEVGPAPTGGTQFDCTAEIAASGLAGKRGYDYYKASSASCVIDVGANPFDGEDVQQIPIELVSLDLALPPDPDFAFLSLQCGSGLGLPACPGELHRTRLPGGDFQVDSFFDIEYRIEFQGAGGGPNDGLGGSSFFTSRWHMYQPQHIRWGLVHRPVGECDLGVSATDGLTVSNLGSSGEDGVSIDLAGGEGGHVEWQPHAVLPGTSCGVRLMGDADGVPFSSTLIELDLHRPLSSSDLNLTFDASGSGASSAATQVYDVFLVGEVPGNNEGSAVISPVGGDPEVPPLVGCSVATTGDGSTGSPFIGACVTLHFQNPVLVQVPGGPPLVGDRVRVCVSGNPVTRLSSMRCVSDDPAGFEIARSSVLCNGRFVSGDDGTVLHCWDGSCRVSGLFCPHSLPYRCVDGSCAISPVACPPALPAPSLRCVVSPRDAASGLPTGKRQHGPMLVSTTGGVLESPGQALRVDLHGTAGGVPDQLVGTAELRCLAGGTMLTSVQWPYQLTASTRVRIHENPLHGESAHEGVNPLYEGVVPPGVAPGLIDGAAPVLVSCVGGAPGPNNPLDCPAFISVCFVDPVTITAPDGQPYTARELILCPEDPALPEMSDLSRLSVGLEIPGFAGAADDFGIDGVVTGPVWQHGLTHVSQGSCTIEREGPEQLTVSNIGSSGQDGVSIELGRGEGARVAWAPVPVCTPDSSFRCGVGPVGDLNRDGRLDLVVVGRADGSSCDLGLNEEGHTVQVVCRDAQGNPVGNFQLPSDDLGVCSPGPGGESPEVRVCGMTPHLISSGGGSGPGPYLVFSNPVWFAPSDGGSSVVCSRLQVHCDDPALGYCVQYRESDWAFTCGFSGLPDQLLLRSSVCHFVCTPHDAFGEARLLAAPGTLTVSNIGSSGQDGVRIDLGNAASVGTGGSGGEDKLSENVSLSCQPVPLRFHLGGGGGAGKVSYSATGTANPLGGPPVTLGVCALDVDSDGDSVPIEVDFTDQGVDQAQILILQDGFPVGSFLHGDISFPYVIGHLLDPGSSRSLVGFGARSSERIPGGWSPMCYSMRFDQPVEIVFPGDGPGTGFVGDEVRVCPGDDLPTAVPSVAGLYEFHLTVTDNAGLSSLPQLVLTGIPRNDFAAWLQLHFTDAEIAVLAAQNFEGDFDGDGCPDVCEFVEGTDPRVAESPHGRGVSFGTVPGPAGSELIRLSYFTAGIDDAEVTLRSTIDLQNWNDDPSQFRLLFKDPQPDGRTRWEWEVLAPLGSKTREFYGHVTILK